MGAGTLESLRTAGLGFCDNIIGKLHDGITAGNLTHMNSFTGCGREYLSIGECKKYVTYCISGPHQNHHHSRQSRHTPSGRKCSGGSHIQTGWMYKICL